MGEPRLARTPRGWAVHGPPASSLLLWEWNIEIGKEKKTEQSWTAMSARRFMAVCWVLGTEAFGKPGKQENLKTRRLPVNYREALSGGPFLLPASSLSPRSTILSRIGTGLWTATNQRKDRRIWVTVSFAPASQAVCLASRLYFEGLLHLVLALRIQDSRECYAVSCILRAPSMTNPIIWLHEQ